MPPCLAFAGVWGSEFRWSGLHSKLFGPPFSSKRWLLISPELLTFHFGSWPLLPSSDLPQVQTISGHIPHLPQALSFPSCCPCHYATEISAAMDGFGPSESGEHSAHIILSRFHTDHMRLVARQGRKPLGVSFKALIGTICLSSPCLNAQYPKGSCTCPVSCAPLVLSHRPVFMLAFNPDCSVRVPPLP